MIGSNVFVDTAPIIYLVERHRIYFEPVSLFFASTIQQNIKL